MGDDGLTPHLSGGQSHRGWLPYGWEGTDRVRGIVVLSHGFGEHQGRYAHVVRYLVERGYAVFSLDHMGHGTREEPRALIRFDQAVEDLDLLIEYVRENCQLPDVPLFLLGHSMGGAIALRYALAHGDRLAGLILSAPLVEVEGRPLAKAAGRVLGRVAPRLPVAKLDPADVSRDPAVVAAYREDPLVHHGGVPAGTAAEFLRHAATLPDAAPGIRLPTLLMYGTADRLCAPAGAERLAGRLGSEDLTVVPFEGLYHEIFNEPERDEVLAALTHWLDARVDAG